MGGFQVMNELMEMIDLPEWNRTWLTFAREYKEKARTITHNPFPVTRLTAYAAAKTGNRELAAEAWDELWHVWHNDKPFTVRRVEVPVSCANRALVADRSRCLLIPAVSGRMFPAIWFNNRYVCLYRHRMRPKSYMRL